MTDISAGIDATLKVWVNDGLLADPTSAALSAVDHGITVGNGVFEALKVTPQGPFTLTNHLERLTRSATALGLPAPDHDQIRQAVAAVIADRPYPLGKIRITWTGGLGPLGSQAAWGPGSLIVAAEEMKPYERFGALVTAPWLRNVHGAMTGVKTTSYGENVRALAYATERGSSECIFGNTAGNLSEGTGSNIFCRIGDRWVTPPLSAGILAGITRRLILDWVPDVVEEDLTLVEAQQASEVFLTSSLRDVQEIARWDDHNYSTPGKATASVRSLFAARSAEPQWWGCD